MLIDDKAMRYGADDYIDAAERIYGNEDVEFDDRPIVCAADDGAWVAAWVWVPNDAVGGAE